jgi:predicted anti-sigma-YlaC factor YlaD
VSDGEMTCREMVELMSDYLDGALDAPVLARFEEHLTGCGGCTNALEQLRTSLRVAGSLREEPIVDERRELLRSVFRDWRREG